MASKFKKFQELVSGKIKVPIDFLAKVSSSGDFQKVEGLNAILSNWNNILLIPLGSYTDDPSVGSNLYKMVFSLANEETINMVQDEISYRLRNADSRADIISIETKLNQSKKFLDIYITVLYEGKETELQLTVDTNAFAKTIT
jgi:phage baseplate assembly protein W